MSRGGLLPDCLARLKLALLERGGFELVAARIMYQAAQQRSESHA
jgi:hypothetical protein